MNKVRNKKYQIRKGMTIIELLVSLGIIVIVTTGLGIFFSYMWQSKYDDMNRGQSLLAASQGVSKIAENIRRASQADSGSYAISSADKFDLVFYSDIDGDQNRERIHYYLDGNSIMMGSTEPILGDSPTYPVGDEIISMIATNVVNDAVSEPVFIYYDAAGSEIPTPASTSQIRRIGIYISANSDPDRISDTVIETSVSPRNLNK